MSTFLLILLFLHIAVSIANMIAPVVNLGIFQYVTYREAIIEEPENPIMFYVFCNGLGVIACCTPVLNLITFSFVLKTFRERTNEPNTRP